MIKCKLGDLIEFQRGYDLPKQKTNKGKYKVISSNGILAYHDEFKSKPSVVIGRSGTVGKPQLIEEDFWPHNTTLFVKDFKGNYIKYIYYLLKNLDIQKMKTGSNIPTLNRNFLHPISVVATKDIAEQQRIAYVLTVIDNKIDNNSKIITEIESMLTTIYNYWFLQYEFPNEEGKPYKSSGGKMVYNEELKKEIPEGWKIGKCKDIVEVITGKEDANFATPNGKYKFFTCSQDISLCDIPKFKGSAVLIAGNGDFNVKHYTGEFNAYQRTYVLIPNEIKYYSLLYISAVYKIKKIQKGSNG